MRALLAAALLATACSVAPATSGSGPNYVLGPGASELCRIQDVPMAALDTVGGNLDPPGESAATVVEHRAAAASEVPSNASGADRVLIVHEDGYPPSHLYRLWYRTEVEDTIPPVVPGDVVWLQFETTPYITEALLNDRDGQPIWKLSVVTSLAARSLQEKVAGLDPGTRLCDFPQCGVSRYEVTALVGSDSQVVDPGDSVEVGGGTLWLAEYRRVRKPCSDELGEQVGWVWSRHPACGQVTCYPGLSYCLVPGRGVDPICDPMPDCPSGDACACLAGMVPSECACRADAAGNIVVSCGP